MSAMLKNKEAKYEMERKTDKITANWYRSGNWRCYWDNEGNLVENGIQDVEKD